MRKIIYISFTRLTDRAARDWHIEYLLGRGATVEYWDVVALVREQHSDAGMITPDYLRVLHSFAELEKLVCMPENRDANYVMLLTYCGRLARIFQTVSKYDCRMLTFASGALPRDVTFTWRKVAAWMLRPHAFVRAVLDRSKAIAWRKLKLVRPYELIFAAGAVMIGGSSHARRTVPINYVDYDHYVAARSAASPRLVAGRYAVFLDIFLPHHSDLDFLGYPRIEPEAYFRSLNRFFGMLEREHGIKVVIAAHPRANYDSSRFEGRELHRLVTADLVRDAEFVLTHTSTSMSYAVLNGKPLVFIYTNGMAAVYKKLFIREMRHFAEYLDAPLCNIDAVEEARQVDVQRLNAERYERYKYDFLTSRHSEGTPTREILWRELGAL